MVLFLLASSGYTKDKERDADLKIFFYTILFTSIFAHKKLLHFHTVKVCSTFLISASNRSSSIKGSFAIPCEVCTALSHGRYTNIQ